MFSGSIVALVTPMNTDGSVDLHSLSLLVDWHIQSGTSAIVTVGTTGESATLSRTEQLQVIQTVVDKVQGRIPVIAGNGSSSTTFSIEMTKDIKKIGADACLCVTPYYNRPPQEGLYRHFQSIADAETIPQILYNVPKRTGVDMDISIIQRLAEHPNIVGLKEASNSQQKIGELLALLSDKLDLFSGDDVTCTDFILLGGKGVISVTANIVPDRMAQLCQLALQGHTDKARYLNKQLTALHDILGVESNPIPAKWILSQMGKIPQGIRLPLLPLAEEYHAVVENVLNNLDGIEI
ncbi:MAG: 4-hydroxy-tetrahydrodipicolinate synthase [Gammaproteobacteria bacterium CG22_combo_CG10-13_8_21_14_all_40_8]|nr:MAG: 4-hydroxy-tetrahydrodipicolinate synthase [Gammaproteobacteria bacterium CG22_combo_CG10-13_8_21_14_all_40_8]